MAKYWVKRVLVDAVQWTGNNLGEIEALAFHDVVSVITTGEVAIGALEGEIRLSRGDWLVRSVNGELRHLDSRGFDKEYETVECRDTLDIS